MGRKILDRRASIALSSLILVFVGPALAQTSSAPSKIETHRAETQDLYKVGKVVSAVRFFIERGRLDEAESALLESYAKVLRSPAGSPDRQEVVDGLGLIYWHSKRMIELELLHEGERRDKSSAKYTLMHIPDFRREDDFDLSFQFAQAPSSEAASALAQMAVRQVSKLPSDHALVRERQDLFDEWRSGVTASRVLLPPARRREISARVADIDARLATLLPDKAKRAADRGISIGEELVADRPLSPAEVRQNLEPNEALLLFANFRRNEQEFLFLWLITKTEYKLQRIELGPISLSHRVAALRCGLDVSAWESEDCAKLTGKTYSVADRSGGKPLPFDVQRSHLLYKALFADVAGVVNGMHLLLVPSGPLTTLPFQVLVTEPPQSGDLRAVRWLVRDHPLTVLPAVSSLQALRRNAKASLAERPYIGFGNPLLDGNQQHEKWGAYYKRQAEIAREQTGCAPNPTLQTAALRSGVGRMVTAGGIADPANLKAQAPIPETADELCAVARDLGVNASQVRLGARATETEIKRLNLVSGPERLANYRILHFATHGALAGELSGTSEPGLLLTPPTEATQDDDGYLSASEIAGLKLDADWVILSACNTAGAAGQTGEAGAEALSGLARAFFYAGARALLVSHWAVDSDATVGLITKAVGETARVKSVGRAEALRRAMLAMIDRGQPHQSHPSYWAPFVVVGEGGADR